MRRIALACWLIAGCGGGDDEAAVDAAPPGADAAEAPQPDATPAGSDAAPPDAAVPDAVPPSDAARELVAVLVTPPVVVLPFAPYPLTATASYSDGFAEDVTLAATWSSSDPMVATVSAAGVAQARCGGHTEISAKYEGMTGTAMATVIYDGVIEIAILPALPMPLPLGRSAQFSALLTYAGGGTVTVTSNPALTWSSSLAAVVTISADGVAQAVGPGSTSIGLHLAAPAADGGDGVCYELDATPVPLTVCACIPVVLEIEPASATLAAGATQAFTAAMQWTDGAITDETEAAMWSSDAPDVATVSNTPGSRGLATAVAAGTATITAEGFLGLTGTATITVSGP